jgi:hypothetical protein
MECVFCKKLYSCNSSLIHHQRTAKGCIKIQTEQGIQANSIFKCSFCNKQLTTKYNLDNHLSVCKSKLKDDTLRKARYEADQITKQIVEQKEEELDEVSSFYRNQKEELEYEYKKKIIERDFELKKRDEEIKELKQKLKLNEKPTTVKNQTNIETNIENQTNIFNIMTPELVENFFKTHYNLDTLLGGQKSFARFINDGFLKKERVYVCGDRSRQKLYIVKGEKKIEDTDCEHILELSSPGMASVTQVYQEALFNEFPEDVTEDDIQGNYKELVNLSDDRAEFKSELSKVVPSVESILPRQTFAQAIQKMKEAILPNDSKRMKQSNEPLELVKNQMYWDILEVN